MSDTVRTGQVCLRGREHTDLGGLAVAGLDTRVGIALSRGRFPKGYPHLDPNEDAVLAVRGAWGWLLAVADGHNGVDAAEAALHGVAETCADLDGALTPEEILGRLLGGACAAVARAVGSRQDERRRSRTALSLALVQPGAVSSATYGDTVVLRVRGARVKHIGTDAAGFLGPDSAPARVQTTRLRPGDRVVVASDGFTDFVAGKLQDVVATATALPDPQAAAASLVRAAFAGGAGDNVAVAVLL